jgi:transcriptional regulator with XRE-family HTH domain
VKTIRALRQANGWTQFELALKVGVQPQAVYLWESGRRMPQVPQLRRLGELFGICSDEIDLEPVRETEQSPHRPRADRRPGESTPGRDRGGRPSVRGREETSGLPLTVPPDHDPS